jgi:hypothetical protein
METILKIKVILVSLGVFLIILAFVISTKRSFAYSGVVGVILLILGFIFVLIGGLAFTAVVTY